jgi:type IV secretory pathway VirB2 component (pilin)
VRTVELRQSAIASAVNWLEGTLLGSLATTIAVVAVATIGLLMLTGRIDVRRAAQVALGCFMIFGASTIANGILSAVSGTAAAADLAHSPTPPPVPRSESGYPTAATSPFDPYAGAAGPRAN